MIRLSAESGSGKTTLFRNHCCHTITDKLYALLFFGGVDGNINAAFANSHAANSRILFDPKCKNLIWWSKKRSCTSHKDIYDMFTSLDYITEIPYEQMVENMNKPCYFSSRSGSYISGLLLNDEFESGEARYFVWTNKAGCSIYFSVIPVEEYLVVGTVFGSYDLFNMQLGFEGCPAIVLEGYVPTPTQYLSPRISAEKYDRYSLRGKASSVLLDEIVSAVKHLTSLAYLEDVSDMAPEPPHNTILCSAMLKTACDDIRGVNELCEKIYKYCSQGLKASQSVNTNSQENHVQGDKSSEVFIFELTESTRWKMVKGTVEKNNIGQLALYAGLVCKLIDEYIAADFESGLNIDPFNPVVSSETVSWVRNSKVSSSTLPILVKLLDFKGTYLLDSLLMLSYGKSPMGFGARGFSNSLKIAMGATTFSNCVASYPTGKVDDVLDANDVDMLLGGQITVETFNQYISEPVKTTSRHTKREINHILFEAISDAKLTITLPDGTGKRRCFLSSITDEGIIGVKVLPVDFTEKYIRLSGDEETLHETVYDQVDNF